PDLQQVGGNVTVQSQQTLASISAAALATIGGIVTLDTDNALTTLSFPALTSVGQLRVSNDPQLASLDGFASLTTAPLVQIDSDAALASIAGLSGVHVYTVLLDLTDLPALTDVDGLAGVTRAGSLTFQGLAVPSISLPSLTRVDNELYIGNNGTARVDLP